MQYRSFLFDLDGTLSDPQVGIITSMQYALESFGIKEEFDQLKKYIGPPLTEMMGDYLPKDQIGAGIAKYRERFSVKGLFENEMYPGISRMLKNLAAAGGGVYLATSKPEDYARRILSYFHIDGYFQDICGSTMDGSVSRKADVLRLAVQRNGLDPAACVMVGDRIHDMEGAAACNMDRVGVLFGFGSRAELERGGPVYIAPTVESLEEWLLSHLEPR